MLEFNDESYGLDSSVNITTKKSDTVCSKRRAAAVYLNSIGE